MLTNQAAVLTGVQKIEIQDIEAPKPICGEVLLQTNVVGVCGSDVHFFESGKRRGKPIQLPHILGHECAATVLDPGPGVNNLKAGDRVCIEPQITCGYCKYCKRGNYNMCPNVEFPSVPPYPGMLKRYFTIPAKQCFVLPDNISNTEGALIEPFAVGLNAAKTGEIEPGKKAVILGAGCIGLTTLLASLCCGASSVTVVDILESRLEIAKRLGAKHVVNAKIHNAEDLISEIYGSEGPDVVFETAGNPYTMAQAGRVMGRCGHLVMVGNVNGTTPFDFLEVMFKGGDIRTVFRYKNNFQTAIDLIADGKIKIEGILSHRYAFEDTEKAFVDSLKDKEHMIKAAVIFA